MHLGKGGLYGCIEEQICVGGGAAYMGVLRSSYVWETSCIKGCIEEQICLGGEMHEMVHSKVSLSRKLAAEYSMLRK